MNVDGKHFETIWLRDRNTVQIIDQRLLPHKFIIEDIKTLNSLAVAITEMHLRGAPLIGVAAAFGVYLGLLEIKEKYSDIPSDKELTNIEKIKIDKALYKAADMLKATRPTAVNLEWAVSKQLSAIKKCRTINSKIEAAHNTAEQIKKDDIENCRKIGEHGVKLIEDISKNKNNTVNILTHCNAGWLACVDYGTATSPIYHAYENGIDIHVWVDETRPRNQGARLTAWELGQHGIKHTIIADNAGGHLMQHGMVDMVIVGSDRTTHTGDVANKIGTYLKALAAKDNNIPFYAAFPASTIDWNIDNGVADIPVEQRDGDEIKYISGLSDGEIRKVLLTPEKSSALNYAFDVTPQRLVTGIITERGICKPDEIKRLFP